MASKTRILVVDDSVVARRIIGDILRAEADFEVVGTAPNGRLALAKLPILSPDVVTLDVDMPEMDGLQTLAAMREEYPDTRVVMVSNLTKRGAQTTVDALFLGASDYVTKATMTESPDQAREFMREQLVPKIRALATRSEELRVKPSKPQPRATTPLIVRRRLSRIQLVAIGASTGGPTALATLLRAFPADFQVPIVIVQHMPENFTAYLARRLDEQCRISVGEPANGDKLAAGSAWIAPGNSHMEVRGSDEAAQIKIRNGPLVNSCRPSVDVLFDSVAKVFGGATLAVVLTGMGQDGLRGSESLKEAGAQVIVQDQESSVVWGMPGYIAGAGLADAVLPIDKVAGEVLRRVGRIPR